MLRRSLLLTLLLLVGLAVEAAATPCLIFVHGKQTNTNTYTNWSSARSYWTEGSRDFIATATKNLQTPYYVVGYNGTKKYHSSQAAGEVSQEIYNAITWGADGGGNTCGGATSFWVIAHSMGNTVMDFILGNGHPFDANYNLNGPYDVVSAYISLVISVSGAHRGSEAADAVCGQAGPICNFIASFVQDCDEATYWLRSDDSVQVRTYSNSPLRDIFLTGGYEAHASSGCLTGEDDGAVQYASMFACNGYTSASYNNSNVCNNFFKQEVVGFYNLDSGHENHEDVKDDSDRDTRRAIPGGIWAASPNSVVQSSMSAAQLVAILY